MVEEHSENKQPEIIKLSNNQKITTYGATIYMLRAQGREWKWIANELKVPNSTCRNYLTEYKKILELNPSLEAAVEAARIEMPGLIGSAIKQFKNVLEREYTSAKESAPMQKIAKDMASEVLRTAKVIEDKPVHNTNIQIINTPVQSEFDERLKTTNRLRKHIVAGRDDD